jgi:hypothetical protein
MRPCPSCWFGASVCTLDCIPPVKSPADSAAGGRGDDDWHRDRPAVLFPAADAGGGPVLVSYATTAPAMLGVSAEAGRWLIEVRIHLNGWLLFRRR